MQRRRNMGGRLGALYALLRGISCCPPGCPPLGTFGVKIVLFSGAEQNRTFDSQEDSPDAEKVRGVSGNRSLR